MLIAEQLKDDDDDDDDAIFVFCRSLLILWSTVLLLFMARVRVRGLALYYSFLPLDSYHKV